MAIGTLAAVGLGAAGIGSFLSSNSNRKAAKSAANAQTQVAAQNNALARDIYGQNKDVLAPYVNAGVPASGALNGMLGLGTADQQAGARGAFQNCLQNSDYGFQFGEGANAVNSGHAGQGTLQSG